MAEISLGKNDNIGMRKSKSALMRKKKYFGIYLETDIRVVRLFITILDSKSEYFPWIPMWSSSAR